MPVALEKCYELPNHSVKVQELCMDEIATANSWIGKNKVSRPIRVSYHGCSWASIFWDECAPFIRNLLVFNF